jgi:hypothetical protein
MARRRSLPTRICGSETPSREDCCNDLQGFEDFVRFSPHERRCEATSGAYIRKHANNAEDIMQMTTGLQNATQVRDETYKSIIEQAKAQARRYASLDTREGRTAAVAVLRFARSLRARRNRLHA